MSSSNEIRQPGGRWYAPGSLARGLIARPKIIAGFLTGAVVAIVQPASLPLSVRSTGAWIAGALVYLVMAYRAMAAEDVDGIRERAEAEDESRLVFSAAIMLAVIASIVAVFALSSDARDVKGVARGAYVALAVGTIVTSWLVMQVLFTLHYAHGYYWPDDDGTGPSRGLDFPEDDAPVYSDFFYFTTSIGATAQTADVSITSKPMRRLVTIQAVLSFMFNTAILALAINLASSL